MIPPDLCGFVSRHIRPGILPPTLSPPGQPLHLSMPVALMPLSLAVTRLTSTSERCSDRASVHFVVAVKQVTKAVALLTFTPPRHSDPVVAPKCSPHALTLVTRVTEVAPRTEHGASRYRSDKACEELREPFQPPGFTTFRLQTSPAVRPVTNPVRCRTVGASSALRRLL